MPSTPSERSLDALASIEEHAVEALGFLSRLDRKAFVEDRRTFHAVTRCLEIISEASRRVSPEVKARHPDIPWRDIADAGNLYRHEYDNVSADRVFKTASHDLHALIAVVRAELTGD